MKHTKRTRKTNIKRILRWYCKEGKISELDMMLDCPEMLAILEDEGEPDFDDIVRAFDWCGIDLVAIPRSEARKMEWYTITAMPYDDGGKQREADALTMKRRRIARGRRKDGGKKE
jgi:hypothetical protein